MGRRRIQHKEPLTTMHVFLSNYEFIASLRIRGEPLYQTVDRIIKHYQQSVDEAASMTEAFNKTFQEKVQLQSKLEQFQSRTN